MQDVLRTAVLHVADQAACVTMLMEAAPVDVMLASKDITAIKVGLTEKNGLFILPLSGKKTSRARDYYTLIDSRNKIIVFYFHF